MAETRRWFFRAEATTVEVRWNSQQRPHMFQPDGPVLMAIARQAGNVGSHLPPCCHGLTASRRRQAAHKRMGNPCMTIISKSTYLLRALCKVSHHDPVHVSLMLSNHYEQDIQKTNSSTFHSFVAVTLMPPKTPHGKVSITKMDS